MGVTTVLFSHFPAGLDYVQGPYHVAFVAGSVAGSVELLLQDDQVYEAGAERLDVVITIPSDSEMVGIFWKDNNCTAAVYILDDEGVHVCTL